MMAPKRPDYDEPLWNPKQIARYLNVSERWVRREGYRYGLPIFKIGRSVKARPAEVRAWLDQQRYF